MKIQLILLLFFVVFSSNAQKVIPLYNGVAPGSETWNWKEGETSNTPIKMNVAYNVTKPTLTVFTPEKANGVGVILLPGGGLRVVNIESEGSRVANLLTKKGFTVFVLKYRVAQSKTDDPWAETLASLKDSIRFRQETGPVFPLATNDAIAAIDYVRQHAKEYNIDPQKAGIIGFSGGGSLAISMCTHENKSTMPNFAGFIYTTYRADRYNPIPADAPPAFIVSASDDTLASPRNSTRLYDAWLSMKRPVELHIFAKGGHGLRGSAAALDWSSRFAEWIVTLGLISNTPEKVGDAKSQ